MLKSLLKKLFKKLHLYNYTSYAIAKLKNIIISRDGGSGVYWEKRYASGSNSGAGSYNKLAEFKAEIINNFIIKYCIDTVIEWGCGDGNQLQLINYNKYVGIDVSKTAIDLCKAKFNKDNSKLFYTLSEYKIKENAFDLSLSLDVIYHLLEDEVYTEYMKNLFLSSRKYVCIYSCNIEEKQTAHVRMHKFTDYIQKNCPEWKQIELIKNRYPYNDQKPDETSISDFYLFEKN